MRSVVEWFLGISPAEPGQGITWRFGQNFPWPTWILLLFVFGTVLYVGWIYQRDAGHLPRWKRLVLASLRLAAIAAVLFMLSEAVLSVERTGLPFVVVMLDNSGSMSTEDVQAKSEARAAVEGLLSSAKFERPSRLNLAKSLLIRDEGAFLKRLVENHKLRMYTVAEAESLLGENAYLRADEIDRLLPKLRGVAPQGDQTRLGDALRGVLNGLRGAPPSAIVLFSDGVTTDGEKLSAAARYARQKSVPIFAVAMGNSDPVRDVELHNVLVDDVAFVNDPITFSYTLTGHGLEGRTTAVILRRKNDTEPLARQEVTVGEEGKPQKLEITFTPTSVGEYELVIEARPLADESNPRNNSEVRRVNVRDEKIKVLLADGLPRWEYRELKSLLEREKTVDLKAVLQDADPEYAQEDLYVLPHFPVTKEELFQYDVLILGDVNPSYLSSSVLENVREFVRDRGRGVLFVAGPHHNPASFAGTPLESLLPFEAGRVRVPSPAESIYESFRPELTIEGRKGSSLFRFADSDRESFEIWQALPPLFWMVDVAELKAGAIVFATHPLRTSARGKAPLIVTQRFGAGKVLFHATDELWRWRFRTGDVFYGRYWVQVVRFLARSKLLGKDPTAELLVDRKAYRSGESVNVRVRFVDEKLAPAAKDGVVVVVEREDGAQTRLTLSRVPEISAVFEGQLARVGEGRYHAWIASPAFTRAPPAEDFEVRPSERETRVVRTDVAELTEASRSTGGRMYTLLEADRLAADIPPGLPVPLETEEPVPLWNHWLTLVVFGALLCGEWILRKRWRLI